MSETVHPVPDGFNARIGPEELAALRERAVAFESVAGVAYQGASEQVLRDADRNRPRTHQLP